MDKRIMDQEISKVIPGFEKMAQRADALKRRLTASKGFARNMDDHPDRKQLTSSTKTSDKRFARKLGLTPEQAMRYAEVLYWTTVAA